jgi:polysaccharide biosynthesis/export protein
MSMRVFLSLLFFCGFLTGAWAEVEALHPGDTLQISVWQDPKLDRTVVVGPDGMISFPLAGHIQAGGITAQALEGIIKSRLQKNYTGQLDVTVSMAPSTKIIEDERVPKIYVTGEVVKPGPFTIKTSTNIVQAIALAGGLSPFAASRRIQVHRKMEGTDSIFLFDFKAFEVGTDADRNININLRSGDIVIVPERGLLE